MDIKYYTNEQLLDAVQNPELLDAYRKACKEEFDRRYEEFIKQTTEETLKLITPMIKTLINQYSESNKSRLK
jgi:hypothetical protein